MKNVTEPYLGHDLLLRRDAWRILLASKVVSHLGWVDVSHSEDHHNQILL